MGPTATLVWSPIEAALTQALEEGNHPCLLIAPFATRAALKRLLGHAQSTADLQVITRWNQQDLASGAADPSVYKLLREERVPLYINPKIHLKLYILRNNVAFHTSGNLTAKGLGYARESNIEVGSFVELTRQDWLKVFELLEDSTRVDDSLYEMAAQYAQQHRASTELPPFDLPTPDVEFSILSLPASPNPRLFYNWYRDLGSLPDDQLPAYAHDASNFELPAGLSSAQFYSQLGEQFTARPLVAAIVQLIRDAGSARFGLVKQWLQANCSDKPTPRRRELTDHVRVLYDWLDFFYPELSWSRPGHSMVIRWSDGPGTQRPR